MRTITLALTLMACGSANIGEPGGLVGGAPSVCLGTDSSAGPDGNQDATIYSVSGKVVSDAVIADETFNKFDCFGEATRVLTVIDDDGAIWTVGYGVNSEGVDITPELAVEVDDEVNVWFVNTLVWGSDNGLIVTRADGTWVFAAQEGMATDMTNAPGAPMGSVQISAGDAYGPTSTGECGKRRNVRLLIRADDEVDVEAGREQQIAVNGQELIAVNPGSFKYIGDMNCSDVWGPTNFIVYDKR